MKFQISYKDPIIRLLLSTEPKIKILVRLFILIIIIAPIVASWSNGSFLNPSLKLDALHDIGYITQFALFLPFLILFLPFYINGLTVALNDLEKGSVISFSEEDIRSLSNYASNIVNSFFFRLLPYAIPTIIVIFLFSVYQLGGHGSWNSPSPSSSMTIPALLSPLPALVLYFVIIALILHIILNYFVIKQLPWEAIRIQPMHPDGCGGISPLGNFSLRLTKAGIFIGLLCLLGVWANVKQYGLSLYSLENSLIIVSYISGLSIAFFLPLLPARKKMIEVKKRMLAQIATCFHENFFDALAKIDSGDLDSSRMEHLESAKKMYDYAKKMPVFPFNATNISRFYGSVLWPLILIFLSKLFK